MPGLGIGETHRQRGSRGRERTYDVALRLARREDREARVVVFLCPPWLGRPHDPLLIAVDPKDRAIVGIPPPELLAGTGWGAEAFGLWLLLYRLTPQETTSENVAQAVEDGLAHARRVLSVGKVR